MILLDTQVLVWWSVDGEHLSPGHRRTIDAAEPDGIATSAFSVWEVGMLVAKRRLDVREPVQVWLDRLISIPTLHILPVLPQVLLDSTRLPGSFHADPADRIIVATARAHGYALLTTDARILAYEHVRAFGPNDVPEGGQP